MESGGIIAQFKGNLMERQLHSKPQCLRVRLLECPKSVKETWALRLGGGGQERPFRRGKNSGSHPLEMERRIHRFHVHTAIDVACDETGDQGPGVGKIEAPSRATAGGFNLRTSMRGDNKTTTPTVKSRAEDLRG